MKIKTETLRAAFDFSSRATAKSTTIDVLKHVRFIAKDGRFTLACNNLSLFAEASGECEPGELSFCVKADRFGAALHTAGEEIDLKHDKTLAWKSGKSRYVMATLDIENFPVPRRGGTPRAVIEDTSIVESLRRVSFACAARDVRAWTHGVGLEAREGQLSATATDGFRLASLAVNKGSYEDFTAILHRDVVASLPDDATEVAIFHERAEFTYPNGLMVAMLIDDKFPDWRRVLTVSDVETVKASRSELLAAIKAAVAFDGLDSVHIVMKDGQLRVEGEDESEKAEHTVVAQGPDVDVWFLSATLSTTLQAVKTTDLALQFARDVHGRRTLYIEDGPLRCVSAPYSR